jgi:hypothetical protein
LTAKYTLATLDVMAKRKPTRKPGPAEANAMDAVRAAMAAWGKKGGKARAQALSPKRRREIAVTAIQARWRKATERGARKAPRQRESR